MSLLESLVRSGRLVVPGDATPLTLGNGRVVAPDGTDYGPATGPLDFLGTQPSPGPVPDEAIEKIRGHLQLPPTDEVKAAIASAIAASGADLGREHFTAEARVLAERFGLDAPSAVATSSAQPLTGHERLELVSHSIGPRLTTGRAVQRSVRVRNAGPGPIPAGTRVETYWLADAAPAGLCDIPVDIAPGREITLIVRIHGPKVVGPATLKARLLLPTGLSEPFLDHAVDAIQPDLPLFDYEYSPHLLTYEYDHKVATDELMAWIEAREGGRACSLLEIGGGVHPSSTPAVQAGHNLVSVDVTHSQSILGALYFRNALPKSTETLAFLTCDGTRLPFAPATFDGVSMFAAFHHFADPVALLNEVKRVLKPGGFAYIACDCCAPDPASPDYLKDLAQGVNEQMFTLPEYHGFFRAAGLSVARARVDCQSLKVFVVKPGGAHSNVVTAAEAGRAFVRRLYQGLLGREPDATGLDHWASQLAGGKQSRAAMVETFIESAEYQGTMVPLAHLALAASTGVTPDSGRFRSWAKRLRGGEPIVDIAVELTSSDVGGDREAARNAESLLAVSESYEHRDRHATRVAVILLYDALLGRTPDDAGLAHWMGFLDRGGSLSELIETLLDSEEFRAM